MSTILLVDLSSVAHPLWHTSQGSTDPNETSRATVAKVRALASGVAHVAVCCDSGRSFRREIDPTYKAQRPETDATLQHQIALAIETLKGDGFPVWAVKGFEADDLIASATAWYRIPVDVAPTSWAVDPDVLIASSDKDLLQLVGPRVTVKKLTDGTVWDEARVMEKLGIAPNQMRDYLCLVGDASDNIKGAKSIGAKTAAALLQKYGNIEDLFVALTEHGTQFTPAMATNLREFETRMPSVRSLVTLRSDVPLPFEDVFKDRVPADVAVFDGGFMESNDDVQPQVPLPMAPEPSPAGSIPAPVAGAGDERKVSASVGSLPTASTPVGMEELKRQIAQAPMMAMPTQPQIVQAPEVLPPPSAEFSMQLEPRSLREASLLSSEIQKSRLFSAYGTWQGILTTILAGRELGLQAMASLRAFHIIDGKPMMSADLIRSLVLKSGHCEYFRCTERTAERATFVTKRKGDGEISLTFTIAEGRQAWPKDEAAFLKSGWGKNPADMCVARASAKLARLVYADVVFNMYSPEEMDGQ